VVAEVLVVDASVAIPASGSPDGFAVFRDHELFAPPLMWSEARSTIHEALWRGNVSRTYALRTAQALESAPIRPRAFRRLGRQAWELSDELGWAKTYDAEYLALAVHLDCRFVTLDGRLRRGADRLGFVIDPSEI
jgi:predicted nucleic acid-binding protein